MRKNMWNHIRKPLLALSLGLNLAFVAIWLTHSIPGWTADKKAAKPLAVHSAVPSPLHREIGVTPEQWEAIEPLLLEFREQAGKQRQIITSLREQLMELLIMPDADETAIRSKQEEILAGQRRMQNLVIDHLLREKALLPPDRAKKLMLSLCDQCRQGGMVSGKGFGRVLDHSSRDDEFDKLDKEKMEQR
jgi:Spy/CpxP family protein refolding chaperone